MDRLCEAVETAMQCSTGAWMTEQVVLSKLGLLLGGARGYHAWGKSRHFLQFMLFTRDAECLVATASCAVAY